MINILADCESYMIDEAEPLEFDEGNITVIGHICIRDLDTGEIIVQQRDIQRNIEKKKNATDTR